MPAIHGFDGQSQGQLHRRIGCDTDTSDIHSQAGLRQRVAVGQDSGAFFRYAPAAARQWPSA
jgi:hypothetical protein